MDSHGAIAVTGRPFIRYWLPAIAWAGLILLGTSLPRVPGPDLSGHDKSVHVVIYLILGMLLLRALIRGQRWRVGSAASGTILFGGVFGALQELNQTYIPGRSGTVDDFLANLAGLILAVALVTTYHVLRRDHRRNEQGDGSDGGSAAH